MAKNAETESKALVGFCRKMFPHLELWLASVCSRS
jgi:hypothetical protein